MTTSTPAATPAGPRILLTVEAAAEKLSISRTRAYGLLKAGALRSVRVGRLRRVPADALADYVRQLTALAAEQRPDA